MASARFVVEDVLAAVAVATVDEDVVEATDACGDSAARFAPLDGAGKPPTTAPRSPSEPTVIIVTSATTPT
jgi:hypothetical protein